MSRRIIRAILNAQTAPSKTFATLNPAGKNANITLSSGNMVASSAVATSQSVRGTIAFEAGKSYFMEVTWNSGSELYFGVGNASASLSQYPGQNSNSWAFKASTGQIITNGVISAAGPSIATGGTIGVFLKWDRQTETWSFRTRSSTAHINQSILNPTYFTGLTGTLYLMVGSSGVFNATIRTGEATFVYPVPDGSLPGVWTESEGTAQSVYVASECFMASTSDPDYPNQLFMGRIISTNDVVIERSVSCWAWDTGSSASTKVGEIILANQDNALDFMRDLVVRDKEIIIEYGEHDYVFKGGAWSEGARTIVDSVEFTKEGNIRIIMGDPLSLIDKPLTDKIYPVWLQEENNRDKSMPVCIGKNIVDPILVEPNMHAYDVHDDVIWSIAEVRDKGDLDAVNTDYSVRNNGFDKVHPPAGRMSATVNGAVKRGTQLFTDAFTAWSAGAFDNNPTSWTVSGESSSNERVYQRTTGRCALKKSGGASALYMERNVGFVAGTTYVVTVPCTYYSAGYVQFYTSNGAGVISSELFRIDSTKRVGTHSFLVTPAVGQTHLRIQIPASTTAEVEFESVTIYAASNIQRLPDVLTEVCVNRGGMSSSLLDTTAITTLDTKAPYELGYYSRGSGKIRDCLKESMDSFCGWIVPNLSGQLTVGRIEQPSSTAAITITKNDVLNDLVCVLDRAKNLTVSIGGQKNYAVHGDGDLAGSVSASDKTWLKSDFKIVRSATGIVHPIYRHADNAPVRGTSLQSANDIQNEAERMAYLYRVPRYFYRVTSILGVQNALALNPGNTVFVQLPNFDLADGKYLILTGIKIRFKSQLVELSFWG